MATSLDPSSSKPDLASLRIRRDDDPPSTRSFGRWIGVIVMLGLVGGAAWAFRRYKPLFETVKVETMRVISTSPSDTNQVLTASGYIVARVKADVSSRIVGRLSALNVEEGMRVRKGTILARLEDADYRASLAEAKAVAAETRVQEARLKRLVPEGIATQSELDAQSARREAAEARVALAEANLENTIIRAPHDGVVLTKKAKVGETVSPGGFSSGGSSNSSAIVTLADFSTLEVEADVAEANIGRIGAGQPAEIAVEAIPDARFPGRLDRIVPTADRQKATVQVKVRFDALDKRLLPEMQATVKFLKSGSTAAPEPPKIFIPETAAELRGDGLSVRLVVDGKLELRKIETKAGSAGQLEVTSGLSGGEELVVSGAAGKADGVKVESTTTK